MDISKILSERAHQHEIFTDVAKTAMRIQLAIEWALHGKSMRDYQEVALQMITSKIACIANGDPDYVDNWIDIADYALLVVDELEAENKK